MRRTGITARVSYDPGDRDAGRAARYWYEIDSGPEAGLRFAASDAIGLRMLVGRIVRVTYHPDDQFAKREAY